MGRHKLSESVRQRTEEKILAVATRVFAEHGFADIGMRDIACELNITASKIYQFFPDKQALYNKCCDQIFDRYSENVEQQLLALETPREKIECYTRVLCESLIDDPALSRLLQRQLLDQDEAGFVMLTGSRFRSNFQQVVDWIAELTDKKTSVMRAYSLFAYCNGLVYFRVIVRAANKRVPDLRSVSKISKQVLSAVLPEIFGVPFAGAQITPKPEAKISDQL